MSAKLINHCDVALLGSAVRAIATDPRTFFSPFCASSLIGASVGFLVMSGVNPPPWIMNPGITR